MPFDRGEKYMAFQLGLAVWEPVRPRVNLVPKLFTIKDLRLYKTAAGRLFIGLKTDTIQASRSAKAAGLSSGCLAASF